MCSAVPAHPPPTHRCVDTATVAAEDPTVSTALHPRTVVRAAVAHGHTMKNSKHITIPNHFGKTQQLIKRLEERLSGKVICYWISPNGSVCQNDVNVFNEILGHVGKTQDIYLFIKSDGGDGKASLRMVHLLRQYCRNLYALVPLNCESAATMLALGSDLIYMGPMAFLTPVDTSVRHDLSPVDKSNDRVSIGVNEMERIISMWNKNVRDTDENAFKTLYQHIHPLAIAAVDRAGSLSNMLCNEIMGYHIKDRALRQRISKTLNSDYPSHGYPIVLKEAQRIGIKAAAIDADVNDILIQLNELYSEMGQKCRIDYDPHHHRDYEVLNIIECGGTMVYYHLDKEWHYKESERTWRFTNDYSAYKQKIVKGGAVSERKFHVR